VTATIFPSIVLFAVGWFFALKHFPHAVVYSTILLGVMILVALGLMAVNDDPNKDVQVGLGNFICAGGVVIFTFIMRKQISFVCRVCAAACKILKLRLSIFAAAFVLKLIWACIIGLALWFLVASDQIVEIQERDEILDGSDVTFTTCDILSVGGNYKYGPLLAFLWVSSFFDMGLALLSAVGIGGYYFHRDDPLAPQYPAFTALGWVFSRSAGAVAESSVIVSLVQWAQLYLDFKRGYAFLCVCNPIWWVFKVIWFFVGGALSTISRFLVIMHGFHGGDFSTNDPRRPAKEALFKHLGTGFMNGLIGQEVLSFSASLLATVIGLCTFMWIDAIEEIGFLKEDMVEGIMKLLPTCYLILAHLFYRWGLAALVLITLFHTWIFQSKQWSCIFAGFFVTCVAKIVLQWFVDVVFHATDGLLYCYVLEAESGCPVSEDMQEIHDIIQDSKGEAGQEEEQPIKSAEGAEGYGALEEGGEAKGDSGGEANDVSTEQLS